MREDGLTEIAQKKRRPAFERGERLDITGVFHSI